MKGQTNVLIQASLADLQQLVISNVTEAKLHAFLNRFENVLIGTNELAKIHSVNPKTVLNYVKDGLIVPEMKLSENDHHQFRLSYVLTLDFKELQKQLRAKNKEL